ncbi:ECF transporter S component [Clostridium sp. A1-XYC3]|uniref:ECF transporter S component n=1 Tax=Clostridium tanneri TaxID=3037988 RepID=A0ABU4JRQ4_9CLOT|nr:ECF transporter S component [Clostridium sp. A1-XYC3]MDW8800837.1 ECF transporter S component [Clostridium sp. A1-XYC3]
MKKISPFHIVIIALCANINIAGSFIALNLKLPVYLDTIGTILASFLMGTTYGVMVGIISSLVATIAFDPVSFFFTPAQIVIAIVSGVLYSKNILKGIWIPVGILAITVSGSLVASIIAAFAFGGITSSGSSYVVAILRSSGVNLFKSVFTVQIFTDILDKSIAVAAALLSLKWMPKQIILRLKRTNNPSEIGRSAF